MHPNSHLVVKKYVLKKKHTKSSLEGDAQVASQYLITISHEKRAFSQISP
jgi:hypothetical protein